MKISGYDPAEAGMNDEERMAAYVSSYCRANGLVQTDKALAFASEKHRGQYRRSKRPGERIPYICHPLMMTCHAIALGLDEDDLLSACLLHDVCEDCGVAPEDLPAGPKTREAVRLLTKPGDFDKSHEAESLYYGRIEKNRIASAVKLLDRCNNVSSMAYGFTDKKIDEYIKETQTYVYPLLKKTGERYPEYSAALFLIRYQMDSVIEALCRDRL